jgi:hypothetical protein
MGQEAVLEPPLAAGAALFAGALEPFDASEPLLPLPLELLGVELEPVERESVR